MQLHSYRGIMQPCFATTIAFYHQQMQKHACVKRPTWMELKSSNSDPNWPTLQYNVAAIRLFLSPPPSWKPHYGVRLISSIHASHEALWKNNKQPHIDFKTCMKKKKMNTSSAHKRERTQCLTATPGWTHSTHTHTTESDVMLCACLFSC